jgi:NAD(P)-dependent dehydrogenase (short-subunit alcohol dehydrogenase family)
MSDFSDIPVTVVGASRGLGRTIAETFYHQGARVLVTARGQADLDAVARALPGIKVLACDAAQPDAPRQVFAVQTPQILILCGGAVPPCHPLHEMDWDDFSIHWNSDVRMSFEFLRAALRRPLPEGTTIVTIGSGAMVGGSPISGGYAGAKRMQVFMSGYAQKESDRAGLGLRFLSLSPAHIMPEADVGKAGITGYAAYNGVTEAAFIEAMGTLLTLQATADALVGLVGNGEPGGNFLVSPDGVSALS